MELNEIKSTGKWSDIANEHNTNYAKINAAVTKLEYASNKNVGIFASSTELTDITPSTDNVVAWVGATPPYAIWKYTAAEGWVDTGETYSPTVDVSNRYLAIEINETTGVINAITSSESTIDASMDDEGIIYIIETF